MRHLSFVSYISWYLYQTYISIYETLLRHCPIILKFKHARLETIAKIPKKEKNSEMKEKLFPSGLLTKRDIGEISFYVTTFFTTNDVTSITKFAK